jgi:hypothetical protein
MSLRKQSDSIEIALNHAAASIGWSDAAVMVHLLLLASSNKTIAVKG